MIIFGDYISCKPRPMDGSMMHHNQGPWTMPSEFEAYLDHYDAAKAAWTRLYVALDDLVEKIEQARANPQALVSPAGGSWPTQQHLRELFEDAQKKTIPLQGEYNALPARLKGRADPPQSAQQNAMREGSEVTFRIRK
jgi:hypothetical protein